MMKTFGLAYLSRWMGEGMGALKLNRIRVVHDEQEHYALKQRRWFSPPLMEAGNLYLRLFRMRIRWLRTHEWLRREREMYHTLYGEEIMTHSNGWLRVPWRGNDLSILLFRLGPHVRLRSGQGRGRCFAGLRRATAFTRLAGADCLRLARD